MQKEVKMKTVIVYKSQTGFTKRYAEWIAADLKCDTLEAKRATKESLKPYDVVVYGGGITAGQIGGLKKFKTIMATLTDKKMIVYGTGATPVEERKAFEDIKKANFSEQEIKNIPYYYFQSGVNYENMNLGSKMIMKMFASMLAKKSDKTPEEKGMADAIKQSCDFSKKEYINPLVDYVNGL
jgi:menaquinone-dependent protoporphyrinogen IX oxidase